MAIVGGTASKLGGGKFSNGAVSGAFVHMFNTEIKSLVGKFVAKKQAENAAKEALNTNKSMERIIGTGASGAMGGAISGAVYLGSVVGPIGLVVGFFSGAVLGFAGGLISGVAMEASGFNDAVDIKHKIEYCSCGQPRNHPLGK